MLMILTHWHLILLKKKLLGKRTSTPMSPDGGGAAARPAQHRNSQCLPPFLSRWKEEELSLAGENNRVEGSKRSPNKRHVLDVY